MLTAIFSDIHGNREAFEACLAHAREAGADRHVLLGDLVGYGADPAWVVERAGEMVADGALALLGNHDAAIEGGAAGMNENAALAIAWTVGRLSHAQRDFLKALPLTRERGDILFVHASAHDPGRWEYITGIGSAAQSLHATAARITVCGHVHVPALYHLSPTGKMAQFTPSERVTLPLGPHRRWLAVMGAVGQPRDYNPAACYALLDEESASLTYIRVPYDVETAAMKIVEAGLPPWLGRRLCDGC
jgi:diadenosine tetraphosphatase ApaH/serine/threonine PP2A family protein phosphatase